ncbi:hypothetical protein N039_09990 [Staphylococcus sp. EGD-HP3]|nr:hypothetical protein N039_09990 [Staphylococcus sp. EGD-HP3]
MCKRLQARTIPQASMHGQFHKLLNIRMTSIEKAWFEAHFQYSQLLPI